MLRLLAIHICGTLTFKASCAANLRDAQIFLGVIPFVCKSL